MKKAFGGVVALLSWAPAALAVNIPNGTTSVPEISALEGTAALAAVAAIVLLVWERRRRVA